MGHGGVSALATHSPSPEEIRAAHQQRGIDEFRTIGGIDGGQATGVPLPLLTTTGARSGQSRTRPVSYTKGFNRYGIAAAKQGSASNPDGYRNLVANPKVMVEVGDETFRATARVTSGKERHHVFDRLAAKQPGFVEYQSRTQRQRPAINLERVLGKDADQMAFNRDTVNVTVDLGQHHFAAQARVTAGEERQRLFERLKDVIPRLGEPQTSTSRELSFLVLERAR